MGVKGLLQALKPITRETNLGEFIGQKAAIDGYAWLHKAAFTAVGAVTKGELSDRPTKYCMKRIQWLQREYNITPVIVVDGRPLPSKEKTNATRHQQREASRKKGELLAEQGHTSAAHKALSQAISISWSMVEHFLQSLVKEKIEFIVAPYEADAQLGYLSRTKYVDFVISEDSDLLLFGCTRVCYKLSDNGRCLIIDSEALPRANLLPLTLYDHDLLIILSAVSGCDYTDGVRGLGLKKAGKHIANVMAKGHCTNENDGGDNAVDIASPMTRIDRLGKDLGSAYEVDEEKINELKQAYLTFKYQTVWDPQLRKCVHLTDIPKKYPEEDYLGPMLNEKDMRLICTGKVEPKTLKPSKLAGIIMPSPQQAFRTPSVAVTGGVAGSSAKSSIASFFKVVSPDESGIAGTLTQKKTLMIKNRSTKTITVVSDDEEQNEVKPPPASVSPPVEVYESPGKLKLPQKRSISDLFSESIYSRKQKALRHFRSEKISFS